MAVLVAEFTKLRIGLSFEFRLDRLQTSQSLGSDSRDGLTLIIAATGAPDQAPVLQTINQAGDIRCALDHALGNFAAGMPLGMDAPQDSQHVVLRPGESVALANLVDQVIERAGCYRHAQQYLLLRARKARLFQPPFEGFSHPVLYSQK